MNTTLKTTIFNDKLEKPFIEDYKNFEDYVKKLEKYVSKLENKNVEPLILKRKGNKHKQKKINKNLKCFNKFITNDYIYISFEDVYKINGVFKFLSFKKVNTKITIFNEFSYYGFLNIITNIITKNIKEKTIIEQKHFLLDEEEKQLLLELPNENNLNKIINIDVLIDFFGRDNYKNFEEDYGGEKMVLIILITKLVQRVVYYCLKNKIQPVKNQTNFVKTN